MAQLNHGDMSPSEERTWSTLVHAAAFAGLVVPFGLVLGPLIVWLIKKPESALVDRHGRAALNFQISMLAYFVGAVVLLLVRIGLLLIVVLAVFWFVMVVVATIRAAKGRDPGYLLSIAFLK